MTAPSADLRSGPASRPLSTIFAGAAFFFPLVAVLVPKGLPIIFAAAVLAALPAWRRVAVLDKTSRPFAGLLAAILAWGLASTLWADQPVAALREVLVLLLTFGGAFLLAATGRAEAALIDGKLFRRALISGYIVGLAVLGEELLSGGWVIRRMQPGASLFYFNQGAAVMAILAWPAMLALVREGAPKAALCLFPLALVVVALGESESAGGGLLVGGLAALVALYRPKATILVAAVLTTLGVLTAPLVVRALPSTETLRAHFIPEMNGLMPRIAIWNYTADRIEERPLAGWGLNSSRFFSSAADKRVLDPNWDIVTEPLPLHPHNAILQWWLELGLVGAALFAAVIGLLYRALLGRASALPKALGLAQLTTAISIASLGYGIWQGWWLATLTMTLVFMVRLWSDERPPHGGA